MRQRIIIIIGDHGPGARRHERRPRSDADGDGDSRRHRRHQPEPPVEPVVQLDPRRHRPDGHLLPVLGVVDARGTGAGWNLTDLGHQLLRRLRPYPGPGQVTARLGGLQGRQLLHRCHERPASPTR